MGGGIFVGQIDFKCTCVMMVFMLVFAMTWEKITDTLEERLEGNKAYSEMLTKIYKELMILGFIAFAVILAKEFGMAMSPEKMHCFEFCDLLVSICVLLYVFQAALSTLQLHLVRRKWDRIALKSVHRVTNDLQENLDAYNASFCKKVAFHLPFTTTYHMRDDADFKVFQMVFKLQFHLDKRFDYVMYAKNVLQELVVEVTNIQVSHWCSLVIFCAVSYFIADIFDSENQEEWCIWCGYEPPEEDETGTAVAAGAGGGSRRHLAAMMFDSVSAAAIAEAAYTHFPFVQVETHRRQLGGAPKGPCKILPCGLNSSDFNETIRDLTSFNSTKNYTNVCKTCGASTFVDPSNEKLTLSFALFTLLGYLLLGIQSLINHSLDIRRVKVLKYSGAKDKWNVPELLLNMEKEMVEMYGEDAMQVDNNTEAAIVLEEDEEENAVGMGDDARADTAYQGHYLATDNAHMIHFKMKDRTAMNVLPIHTHDFIIWTTKFVQLMNCFYLGFYLCHMSFLVGKTKFDFLSFLPGASTGPWVAELFVHLQMLIPCFVVIAYALPITVRNLSLLSGVLFLNDEAVNDVIQHMERMSGIRERIISRLLKTSFLKGKPKQQVGNQILDLLMSGEIVMLQKLAARPDEDRIMRSEMNTLLAAQDTQTTDEELAQFMDRQEYEEFLKESPADQATAQTAKTLQVSSTGPDDDSITIREFTIFLLRAVCDAANVAAEHGVGRSKLEAIEQACTSLATIDSEAFSSARLLARTRSMFRTVDRDNSGSIDRAELWKAIRKYRIPITADDLNMIMRVMDPDQSGVLSMQEWVDFMLASEENFEAKAIESEKKIRDINAARTFTEDLMETTEKMAGDLVSGVENSVMGNLNNAALLGKGVIELVPGGGESGSAKKQRTKSQEAEAGTMDNPLQGSASKPEMDDAADYT